MDKESNWFSKQKQGLFFLMLALILILAACGGKKEETGSQPGSSTSTSSSQPAAVSDPVKITMWMTPIAPEETLKSMIDQFNASQSEIQVELTMLDFASGREKIKTAIFARQGPDIFYIGNGLDQAYIEEGVLLPLEEAGFSADDFAKFTPLINMNSADGKILAAPVYYDAYLLYYRKDVLSEYGFDTYPKTWDELKEVARTITEKSGGSIMGYQHKGADDHLNAINLTWQTLLGQAGGRFIENGKSALNSPEGKQALEYMKSFYTEGISQLGPSAVNGFREGKIAMFQFAQNVIQFDNYASDENMKGKWGVAPVPAGPKSGYSYAGGQGVAINAATKHKEAAGKVLKWFVQPAHMPIWMQNGHGIPAYDLDKVDAEVKAKVEEEMANDKENWDAILEQIKRNTPDLMVEQRLGYTARWDAQKNLIIPALSGEASVEETLSMLDAQINQSLQ